MVGGAIAAPVYWLMIEANHPQLEDGDKKDGDEEVKTIQQQGSHGLIVSELN
jgi:hypothetical protein